jgi:UDP-N-acetyl-D-glucosamine dehydrogenase
MNTSLKTNARDRPDGKMVEPLVSIVERFKARTAKVGIIGLGYVGLPLACAAANKGFRVVGFDIDAQKVDRINDGRSYISHIKADDIAVLRRAAAWRPPMISRGSPRST